MTDTYDGETAETEMKKEVQRHMVSRNLREKKLIKKIIVNGTFHWVQIMQQ